MVGGLSLPNATKRDFQDTTELHCSERMRCKPSKITKIETKTCIFWWTKSKKVLNFIHSESCFFVREFDGIIKWMDLPEKYVKSLGILVVSFCFDAIGKHSAKYQVILTATLEFRVNLNNTWFAVVTCCCSCLVHPCTTETWLIISSLCFWWFSDTKTVTGRIPVWSFQGFCRFVSVRRFVTFWPDIWKGHRFPFEDHADTHRSFWWRMQLPDHKLYQIMGF